jgi:ribosomal protein L35
MRRKKTASVRRQYSQKLPVSKGDAGRIRRLLQSSPS